VNERLEFVAEEDVNVRVFVADSEPATAVLVKMRQVDLTDAYKALGLSQVCFTALEHVTPDS